MTRTNVLLTALLLATAVLYGRAGITTSQEAPTLSASEIFHRLDQENARRDTKLRSYLSMRRYSVFEPNHPDDAALTASMKFVAPSSKTFTVLSQDGVGWIHKRVFQGLMDAEQDSGKGKQKTDSSISSANYNANLIGEEALQGRNCYVLELKPKREDKYLMIGKIWVDKQDFAVAKLEGEPMKSPSIFVTRAHLVRQYQKIGDFWLQLRDETLCHIRVAGDYVLRIDYSDYKLDVAD